MATNNPLVAGLEPVHPGELLREDVLPALDFGKAELARRLHISRPTLYALLDGKQAVTAPMALRLGRLFGNGPNLWLSMQQTYDLKLAEQEMAAELATIEPIPAAA